MGDLTEEQANEIVTQAEVKATEAEQAAAIERRRQREQDRIDTALPPPKRREGPARRPGSRRGCGTGRRCGRAAKAPNRPRTIARRRRRTERREQSGDEQAASICMVVPRAIIWRAIMPPRRPDSRRNRAG